MWDVSKDSDRIFLLVSVCWCRRWPAPNKSKINGEESVQQLHRRIPCPGQSFILSSCLTKRSKKSKKSGNKYNEHLLLVLGVHSFSHSDHRYILWIQYMTWTKTNPPKKERKKNISPIGFPPGPDPNKPFLKASCSN